MKGRRRRRRSVREYSKMPGLWCIKRHGTSADHTINTTA